MVPMREKEPTVRITWVIVLAAVVASQSAAAEPVYRSHPPVRPLPSPSRRPLTVSRAALAPGAAFFVDPVKGKDGGQGTKAEPWNSITHALKQLKPGDTLYLRGGVHRGQVVVNVSGTTDRPITVRAYPGELAILDGGLREFLESPETAWEPCPKGVEGEFWSVKAYPGLGAGPDSANVRGFFADSMVPFHGYRYANDHRDDSMVWDLTNKVGAKEGVYCGPGVFYDVHTGRFHARLAHTDISALGEDNYRGETDPRKLPLVLATVKSGPVLAIRGMHDLRFEDLVIRGSATSTVEVSDSARVVFDGLTVYGGHTCFTVKDTAGLRLLHTACRGQAAPWTFRGHLKYRSTESRLFSASAWTPTSRDNRDFEMAYCEFTDSVDGVFIGNVRGVHFHHNLLDNVSDDGIFLTAGTAYDGVTPGGDVHVYQNLLSRCLTTFAFGVGHGRQKVIAGGRQTGAGVHVYRNVFDFRRPVMYHMPAGPGAPAELPSRGRFASDHGSPTWEPMNIYHNTLLADDPGGYSYGTWGLAGHIGKGTRRRVFNNIICQVRGMPGLHYPPAEADLQVDGNLLWSAGEGARIKADPLAAFRDSKVFTASEARYAPGWSAHDRFADPQFLRFTDDWRLPLDLHVQASSPAVDAGVPLPTDWPDPVRAADAGKPDAGVLPVNGEPWRVGVTGRLTMFGAAAPSGEAPAVKLRAFATASDYPRATKLKPAVIVQGYPAPEVPLVEFALRRRGAAVTVLERSWQEPQDYKKFGLVVITGSLARAGIEPRQYGAEELKHVHNFLEDGGTLFLTRGTMEVFATPHGREFLAGLTGACPPEKDIKLEILQPQHAWVKHLDPRRQQQTLPVPGDPLDAGAKPAGAALARGYLDPRNSTLLGVSKGERLIGTRGGQTALYRLSVGKGRLIYLGWQLYNYLPAGKQAASLEAEKSFEEQMQLLFNIVADVYPAR